MNRRPSLPNQSGAILVQVAVSLLMLMGFTVFVVDYGILWVARGQAQNAADAGALAGAIAKAWDDDTDPPPLGGIVDLAARNVAQANLVWNAPGVAVASFDPCPPGVPGEGCIRVDVFRNGEAGSQVIGMFFGGVLGMSTHGVRATATAQVRAANASDCLKPFAILDKEPSYNLEDDYGTELVIKDDGWPGDPGYHGFVNVGQGTGANALRDITRSCKGTIFGIGDVLPQENGNVASLGQAVLPPNGLIALDPNAVWNPVTKEIDNSCVETGTCMKFPYGSTTKVANPNASVSPRIIPLAIAVRSVWMNNKLVQIKTFLGFFVTSYDGPPTSALHGIIVTRPGVLSGAAGTPGEGEDFTRVIVLVR